MKLENYSKGLLFFSGIMIVLIGVPRLLLNTWFPYSEYLFFAALILFLLAGALSYKIIIEFFTMRTTKYGLNMGTLILLGVLLYICVNFFAFRYDKSVDITGDKLNSLSLQSLEILDNLKEDVELRAFFQGKIHSGQNMGLKTLFKKYQRESSKIKTKFVDAHKDPSSAQYLKREDKGRIVLLVKRGDKTERVKDPIGEETLTSALYRLNQIETKKIYFLSGHGERSQSTKGSAIGTGVALLVDSLKEKGFAVEDLNLLQNFKVPQDASMLAVVGPKKNLLDSELKIIKNFVTEGGRLLLALDPSSPNNLSAVSAMVGLKTRGDYLLSTQTVAGSDAMSILGQNFSRTSKITEDLDAKAITLFYEASGVEVTKNSFNVEKLVTTDAILIPVSSLKNYQLEVQGKVPEAATVGMSSSGSFVAGHEGHNHADEAETKFEVALFGDSDFLSDVYFETGYNKDLALNTFAHLAGETNLISIRPRTASDTKLILTTANSAFVLIFPILIPLFLIIAASIIWFRRRGA